MPISKNRKNHKQKVEKRRVKMKNGTISMAISNLHDLYLNFFFPEKLAERNKFREDLMKQIEEHRNKKENVSE